MFIFSLTTALQARNHYYHFTNEEGKGHRQKHFSQLISQDLEFKKIWLQIIFHKLQHFKCPILSER